MAHKSIPFLILHRLSRQQQQLVKKQGTIMPHTQLVLVHPSGCGTSADLNQTPSQCNVGGYIDAYSRKHARQAPSSTNDGKFERRRKAQCGLQDARKELQRGGMRGKGQGTHCTALVRVSFGVLEKGC
jgi:hypothetical protein